MSRRGFLIFGLIILVLILIGASFGLYFWQNQKKEALKEEYQAIVQIAENAVEIDYNTFKEKVVSGWVAPEQKIKNEKIDWVVASTDPEDPNLGTILGRYTDGGYFWLKLQKDSSTWKNLSGWLYYYGVSVTNVSQQSFQNLLSKTNPVKIDYNTFWNAVESGYQEPEVRPKNKNIKWVIKRTNSIDYTIGEVFGEYADGSYFIVYFHTESKEWSGLNEWLDQYGVSVKSMPIVPRAHWTTYIPHGIVIFLALGGVIFLFYWIFWRKGPGFLRGEAMVGKTATLLKSEVKFQDVGGLEEPVKELERVVKYLKNPRQYVELGAIPPRGILLYGPPGCGKTYLAMALAGEAGVPVFKRSGTDYDKIFMGAGPEAIRQEFQMLEKNAPCILTIDEFDALARRREAMSMWGEREAERTLNTFLYWTDEFAKRNLPVVIIGMTNRPDVLDSAALRSGRFDWHIEIPPPDSKEARKAILKVHLKKKKVAKDVDLDLLARHLWLYWSRS